MIGKPFFVKNDFIGPLGSEYVWRIQSATPTEIANYLTLITPFDDLTWAFLISSALSAFVTLMIIDHAFAHWTNSSKKGILHESKVKIYNEESTLITQDYFINWFRYSCHWRGINR